MMSGEGKKFPENVVPIGAPVPDEAAETAFGVSVSKSGRANSAANEGISSLMTRLVVDESLPLYLAALDGTVLHHNEHYRALDTAMGETVLAAGSSAVGVGGRVASLLPLIEDVRASGRTVRAEETAVIHDRERVFMGRHMPIRNEQGDLIAVAGTYEDVTLQVRGLEEIATTQARFQDFTRASSDWFFECDAQMKLKSLSDRFTAIVGQPSQLFLGGKLDQIGSLEKNMDGRFDYKAAVKGKKPFRDQLLVLKDSQDEDLKFHLSAVPIFDRTNGDFQGYRGVGMDVTSRYKQVAETENARSELETLLQELTRKNFALDEASAQAKSALRAKNEFLAAMSHELKTPLNAIIGFADTLKDERYGDLDSRYMDHAKDIAAGGRHLLALINDILDVAVIEGGQLRLAPVDTLLEDCVTSAIQMNIEAARSKNQDVSGLAVDGETWVRADERRLRQILVNLLSNAVKFTPEGGRIGIDMGTDQTGTMAEFTVWDTGIGIPADKLSTIFEKFEQVNDGIYSRGQEGTGLGLHISRELARRMGGEISVTSTQGEGSRFTVTVPLSDGEADEDLGDFI